MITSDSSKVKCKTKLPKPKNCPCGKCVSESVCVPCDGSSTPATPNRTKPWKIENGWMVGWLDGWMASKVLCDINYDAHDWFDHWVALEARTQGMMAALHKC